MKRDLITQTIEKIVLKEGKELLEAQSYLTMRFRISVDLTCLSKRLKKLMQDEQAVA
ncbi:hypothetical protein [Algoriphagus confluentis]|uniref:Uncharacterized protein n=1 Tax=Algoriphagus confluentis TaxID=1697556 RepID=A0ABQ6PJ93_9BACT|nr:hypothetical protein Aconfl_06570 [Algoriphagus confluentis]